MAGASGESSPSRRSAGGRWRGVPWAPWLPPPRRDGRQLNPESGAQAGPSRLAPRAHCGPRRAGARACPTRRPGVRVTPSARLGSWRAATTWWVRPRQECGASSMDCLASPAPWPGRQVCPARGRCLPSVVGSAEKFPAFHRPWGRPPSLCPAATSAMASESAFSRRKPLGTLQVGHRGERGLVARGSTSGSESFQRPTTVQPQVPKPPQCKHHRG